MPFDTDVLDALSASGEVSIETSADGVARSTVIWVAVEGDDVFVRSVRGVTGRWYLRMLDEPDVTVVAGDLRIPAHAVLSADPGSIERASRGLSAKYSGRSLEAMLEEHTLATTTRLDPR